MRQAIMMVLGVFVLYLFFAEYLTASSPWKLDVPVAWANDDQGDDNDDQGEDEDGLINISVFSDKTSYSQGERINITVIFENTSDKPLTLSSFFGVLRYEITLNQQPLEPTVSLDTVYEPVIGTIAKNFQRLEPGGQVTIQLPNFWSSEGNELHEGRPSHDFPLDSESRSFSLHAPGEYTIVVTYELTLEDMGQYQDDMLTRFPDVFLGRVTSPPLTFLLQ